MDKNLFIQNLRDDLGSRSKLRNPYVDSLIFFIVVILPAFFLVIVLGFREDISILEFRLNYFLEGLILLLLFYSMLLASLKSREPGVSYEFERSSAIVLFLMWVMSSEYIGHAEQMVVLEEPEVSCARLVFLSTLAFGTLLYYFVRKGYLLNSNSSFFMSVFTGAVFGGILLHLVCPGDTSSHLIFWHVVPVVVWPCLLSGGYWWWKGRQA